VNNEHHHARNLPGALVSAAFMTPPEQKTSSRNITVQKYLSRQTAHERRGAFFSSAQPCSSPISQKAKPTSGALLDLRRNLTQPFLSAICPSLMASDFCLEIIYLIVCGSKLIREILSDLFCLLEFSLSRLSRVFNKLKNGAPCPVHCIGSRAGTFLFRSIWDNVHRTLPTLSQANLEYFIIQIRACAAPERLSLSSCVRAGLPS
jgi:hypothetical protein